MPDFQNDQRIEQGAEAPGGHQEAPKPLPAASASSGGRRQPLEAQEPHAEALEVFAPTGPSLDNDRSWRSPKNYSLPVTLKSMETMLDALRDVKASGMVQCNCGGPCEGTCTASGVDQAIQEGQGVLDEHKRIQATGREVLGTFYIPKKPAFEGADQVRMMAFLSQQILENNEPNLGVIGLPERLDEVCEEYLAIRNPMPEVLDEVESLQSRPRQGEGTDPLLGGETRGEDLLGPSGKSRLAEWAAKAGPEDFQRADWRVVANTLKQCQEEIEAQSGGRASWIDPAINIANEYAAKEPGQAVDSRGALPSQ